MVSWWERSLFYGSLFSEYFKQYFKTRLTYRSDFWIEVFSDLLNQSLNLIFILIVFQHTALLGGWEREEIIFIYGYFLIPFALFSCFFNLWGFSERYIVKGEMDRILTRPAHNLFQLMLENLDPSALFGVATGAAVMGYAAWHLELNWVLLDIPLFGIMVLGSVMVYAGIYTTLSAISLFSDSPTGILPMIYNIQNYGRYPINIYNKAIQILLTWILPFAFVGIFPASYFLGKEHWHHMALLTPVMGIVVLSIGLFVWSLGIKRYRGAGS